jgi:hypothetical protein
MIRSPNFSALVRRVFRWCGAVLALCLIMVAGPGAEDGALHAMRGPREDNVPVARCSVGAEHDGHSPRVCANLALSGSSGGIGDVGNNFWGGTTFSGGSCGNVHATNITGVGSCPTRPDVSCSGGLPVRDQHGSSNSPMSMPASGDSGMSQCDELLNRGAGLLNDGDCKAAYDVLKDFMEQCPTYVGGKYNSGVGGTDMFPNIGGAVSCWTAGGKERWPQYLEWLKSVLYLRTDTAWYCIDVDQMLMAVQKNIDARLAVIQYVTSTKHCTDDSWSTSYKYAMFNKHKAWLDSLEVEFRITHDINEWPDSINADTLAHPFDSTYGSIDSYGLSVLRGQQYASSVAYKDLPSTSLLNVRVTENPFDATIGVSIEMQREALVTMELRDLLGRPVPLEYGKYQLMPQGTETRTFATGDLPAGTYYLRVSTDLGEVRTLKLVKQ